MELLSVLMLSIKHQITSIVTEKILRYKRPSQEINILWSLPAVSGYGIAVRLDALY